MYVHEDILIQIIMQSRLSDLKKINLILKKEQSVVILLLKVFSAEKNKAAAQNLKK